MSKFQRYLDKFQDHEKNLKEMGDSLIREYPQSKNLISLAEELSAAVDGLAELYTKLAEAIHEAEQQGTMKKGLMEQIGNTDLYAHMPRTQRDQLAEYLVQNGKGLATEEDLVGFLKESYADKDDKSLIGEFPKRSILKLGKDIAEQAGHKSDEFDAYRVGLDALKDQLSNPESKEQVVDDLAKKVYAQDPEKIFKLFYAKAFENPEKHEALPKKPKVEKPEELNEPA